MATILHITQAFAGGVFSSVSYACNTMAQQGHEVILVATVLSETPSNPRKLLYPEVEFIQYQMEREIDFSKDLKALFYFIRLIKSRRPDIIHLHSSKAGALGRVATLFMRSREGVYYSPRGLAFLQKDRSAKSIKFYKWVEKILHYLGGTLVACSGSEFQILQKNISRSRLALVENAIDVKNLKKKNCKKACRESLIVATTGRLCPQKGVPDFIEIIASLKQTGLDIKAVWIGDGEYYKNELLTAGIELTGWLEKEKVFEVLYNVDIYLQPSLWEGMPLALIETQVMGIPAIVSNIVGNKDVVEHGKTGFITNSIEEYKAHILYLSENKDVYDSISNQAREQAIHRFSMQRLQHDLSCLYHLE